MALGHNTHNFPPPTQRHVAS